MSKDFAEIYAQQLAPVWRFVRARVPSHADAEDVTSEVFARAVRGWARYDPCRGSVGTWLLGIANHVVSDWWRRRSSDVSWERIEASTESSLAPESDPEQALLAKVVRDELRMHLGRLTEKERAAVALRFAVGLKAADVGAVLGVSETAARMLVYRAVSKLQTVMTHE